MGDPGQDKSQCRSGKLHRCVELLNGYFQARGMTLGERSEVEEVWGSKGIGRFCFCFRQAMTSYYPARDKGNGYSRWDRQAGPRYRGKDENAGMLF